MDLTFTGDQEAMVDLVAGFLARESPPSVVRAAEPLGHDPELWSRAVDIGLAGLGAPDEVGGSGASVLDLALVAELVGRHLAPLPFVDTTVATRLLARCGVTDRVERAIAGALLREQGLPAVVEWLRSSGRAGWESLYHRLELVFAPADGTLTPQPTEIV